MAEINLEERVLRLVGLGVTSDDAVIFENLGAKMIEAGETDAATLMMDIAVIMRKVLKAPEGRTAQKGSATA